MALIAASDLHAPALLDYEVASALRGHALAGRLTQHRSADAVDDFGALHIDRYPLARMTRSALDLKENFTANDAAYVDLAQALEAPLVTADAKLTEAGELGIDVRVLRQHQFTATQPPPVIGGPITSGLPVPTVAATFADACSMALPP